jgi:hypothetical protein
MIAWNSAGIKHRKLEARKFANLELFSSGAIQKISGRDW